MTGSIFQPTSETDHFIPQPNEIVYFDNAGRIVTNLRIAIDGHTIPLQNVAYAMLRYRSNRSTAVIAFVFAAFFGIFGIMALDPRANAAGTGLAFLALAVFGGVIGWLCWRNRRYTLVIATQRALCVFLPRDRQNIFTPELAEAIKKALQGK